MKNISEKINTVQESELINEALQEKNLISIAKQLKSFGKQFSVVMGSAIGIRWDLITSGDVKVYNDPEKALPACRKILSYNEPGIIITYKQGEYTYAFTRYETMQLSDRVRSLYGEGASEKLNSIKHSDKVFIYHIDEVTGGKTKLSDERRRSRTDMIVRYKDELGNTYSSFKDYSEFCQMIARENVARYKKIIEQNRALKDTEFEEISKRVNDLLQRCLQVSVDMASGKIKTDGSEYRVTSMLDRFYSISYWNGKRTSGEDGILKLLSDVFRSKIDLKNGTAYNIEIAKSNIKHKVERINELCTRVENTLKEWLE